MELVGVTVAAKELHLSRNRVRQLIKSGRLPAQKIGREYAITREDLEAFKAIDRPVGRPPKEEKADTDGNTSCNGDVEAVTKAGVK